MGRLRIKGLVSVANSVRHDLSQPLSPTRKERLGETVATSLQQVDRIVAKHGVTVEHLPEPTRRAYRFLASVDLNSIPTQTAVESDVPARGSVSLVGIKSYVDNVLAKLAEPISADKPY